eukprot:CAMPEP_0180577162 /NCGR_PEP_ID=MMETSP1037_2-20121125/11793_1 /TAXON_ID=632150 /ORGANISM="Azadinium spinosum, Strain 3D9" /LENGTH=285 /DNA_ID=CAMNT_0022594903 /DNA_START=145 /DNA_END=998 /DNA_ORIENTATION=+
MEEIHVVVADICPYGSNVQWCPGAPGDANACGMENHLDFADPPRSIDNNFFVFTPEECSPELKERFASQNTPCSASAPPAPRLAEGPAPSPVPSPSIRGPAVMPSTTCSVAFQQCGGQEWIGATCCDAGTTCTRRDEFYSQCLPPVREHVALQKAVCCMTIRAAHWHGGLDHLQRRPPDAQAPSTSAEADIGQARLAAKTAALAPTGTLTTASAPRLRATKLAGPARSASSQKAASATSPTAGAAAVFLGSTTALLVLLPMAFLALARAAKLRLRRSYMAIGGQA